MLRTIILAAALLLAVAIFVKTAIAPTALKQDSAPSTADLQHPPTIYGASSVLPAPPQTRR